MATNKKVYSIEINGIKQEIANVQALKKAQAELEEAFESADFGSENYARLSKSLQEVNTRLITIDESVSDLTAADKVDGFVKFGTAITGAFATGVAAAQAFGASSEQIEKYQAKFQVLIATLETFKLIQEATGKENKLFLSFMNQFGSASTKTTEALGKQTIAQRILNVVTKANPIGLVVTAVLALIAAFALVANNIDLLKEKFGPLFDFVQRGFDKIVGTLRDIGSFLTGGLIDDAATAKTKANVEKIAGAFGRLKEAGEAQIKILEAQGGKEREVFEARKKLINDELNTQRNRLKAGIKLNEEELKNFRQLKLDLQLLEIEESNRLAAIRKDAADKAKAEREERAKQEFEDRTKSIDRLRKGTAKELKNQPIEAPVVLVPAPGPLVKEKFLEKLRGFFSSDLGQKIGEVVSASVGFIGQILDNAVNRQTEQLDFVRQQIADTEQQISDSAARSEQLEAQVADSRGARRDFVISQIDKERERETQLEQIRVTQAREEQKRLKEVEKAKRRGYILQKAINIAQAVGNTALAVISALAPPPVGLGPLAGIPLSVATGVLGAIQIATIAAQKFARGTILSGPSHAMGGIKTPFGEFEGGEAVINKRSTAMFRGQLSAINQAGGGIAFADGGITGAPNVGVSAANSFAEELRILGDRIERMQIVVEAVQVVNTANKVAQIKSNATV